VDLIKKNLQKINSSLIYFVVFLIPNQLAFHFWPNYSFVYGLKIDYLSIAIYLSDLLIIFYTIFFLFINKEKVRFERKKLINVFIFIIFASINIFYSKQRELSIIKWIKLIELILFSIVVAKDKFLEKDKIFKTLCYSILFFGTIGVLQIIKGSTIGSLFYFLGERKFNTLTPGISLLNLFNLSILKPYSTFSHPNSLAGYVLLIFIFIFSWDTSLFKNRLLKVATTIMIITLLMFSFSKTAIITLLIILFIYFFKLVNNINITKLLSLSIIIFSLLSPLISVSLLKKEIYYPVSFSERLFLSDISGQMLKNSPLFGIGLNNFIYTMPTLKILKLPFWLLQPVHNIFLLITVEAGLFGIGILLIVLFKYIDYLFKNNKKSFIYILLAILLTGFFDHYWFTLQQNILLIFFFLGLSKNSQIK